MHTHVPSKCSSSAFGVRSVPQTEPALWSVLHPMYPEIRPPPAFVHTRLVTFAALSPLHSMPTLGVVEQQQQRRRHHLSFNFPSTASASEDGEEAGRRRNTPKPVTK
jgi:hypothetical protein